MTEEELFNIASENGFDVRQLDTSHFRLLDNYGMYKFDVYFKHNKKGAILRNSILKWNTQKWFRINSSDEFLKII